MDIFVGGDAFFIWKNFSSLLKAQIHYKFYMHCSKVPLQQGDQIKILHLYSRSLSYFLIFFISPLFNQIGQLRTSSNLQLQPGQDTDL